MDKEKGKKVKIKVGQIWKSKKDMGIKIKVLKIINTGAVIDVQVIDVKNKDKGAWWFLELTILWYYDLQV